MTCLAETEMNAKLFFNGNVYSLFSYLLDMQWSGVSETTTNLSKQHQLGKDRKNDQLITHPG